MAGLVLVVEVGIKMKVIHLTHLVERNKISVDGLMQFKLP